MFAISLKLLGRNNLVYFEQMFKAVETLIYFVASQTQQLKCQLVIENAS